MDEMKNIPENEKEVAVTPDEITVSAMAQDKKPEAPKKQKIFKSRKFRYGTVATAMIALVIVVVIAANMVLSVLSDRFSWALDFTSTGLYDISEETQEVIHSIDPAVEIEITIFYDENNFPHYINEPLNRFANLSNNINVKYIDPEKNPTALTQFGTEYDVQAGAVVVNNGDRVRVFNVSDYFSVDQETGSMYIYIEERLAAGVLYVTKENIPVVHFLTGHGEQGYNNLMSIIANNGADVKELNLLTDKPEFDSNSKVLVICNPTRDYSEAEIRAIEDFLSNDNQLGRNIMYFSSADSHELPNLEAMLATWGIEYGDDIVLESENNTMQNYPNQVVPSLTTEEIMNTGSVISTVAKLYAPNSRSVSTLFNESNVYKTQPIITTSDESYSRDATVVNQTYDRLDTDKSGPFNLGVLSMKYKYINNIQHQSYLLACGSTGMIETDYFNYSGNAEMFMQLYKIMVDEQDDTILAAQKASSSSVASITSTQSDIMLAVTVFVIPIIVIIIGLVVFIRRRFL